MCDSSNTNADRSSESADSLFHMAVENGGKVFIIFLQSSETKTIPHRDPRAVQAEIKKKITYAKDIVNIRYTRSGSINQILVTSTALPKFVICQKFWVFSFQIVWFGKQISAFQYYAFKYV